MNIDKIEISEDDIFFVIYPKKEEVIINNNIYKIELREIEELIRIIRTWNNEYTDENYFDGNRFEVVVYSNGKEDKMIGTRGKPENYENFHNLVRKIYARR